MADQDKPMGWMGAIIGGIIGLIAGGPPGAVLGAAVGHGFAWRNRRPSAEEVAAQARARVEQAFRHNLFGIMGHLAKADGQVSPATIARAEAAMERLHLSASERQAAITEFRRGKATDFPLTGACDALRRVLQADGGRERLQLLLYCLLEVAHADGAPGPGRRQVLERLRAGLGVPAALLARIEDAVRAAHATLRRHQTRPNTRALARAYALLGVGPRDSDAVVKRAYQRLLSQHHPDKLAARGLPETTLQLALERTQEIRRAYEIVRRARAA